mmetsp:Transcript_99621/g.168041  ORF Transcript_99621/g.168041 Transcript_99621/m.168041 type:complete len:121 (+) Transcript_99621:2470-2832(+)
MVPFKFPIVNMPSFLQKSVPDLRRAAPITKQFCMIYALQMQGRCLHDRFSPCGKNVVVKDVPGWCEFGAQWQRTVPANMHRTAALEGSTFHRLCLKLHFHKTLQQATPSPHCPPPPPPTY